MRSVVAALAVLAVVTTSVVGDAGAARRRRSVITAVIGGHRVRFRGRFVAATHTGDSVSFTGATRPRHFHQLIRNVSVSCAAALSAGVFPSDGQSCSINYSQYRFERLQNPMQVQWAAGDPAVHVKIESYDGTQIAGTFQGTLAPFGSPPPPAPVTVEGGRFTIFFPG
jgi:hypothetical protein